MKESNSRCINCHFYSCLMCIHKKPNVERKEFGFPFKYNPETIKCYSYKKRTIDDDIGWEHM